MKFLSAKDYSIREIQLPEFRQVSSFTLILKFQFLICMLQELLIESSLFQFMNTFSKLDLFSDVKYFIDAHLFGVTFPFIH